VGRAGNSVNGQQKVALADDFTMAWSVKSVIATVVALRLDGAITTPSSLHRRTLSGSKRTDHLSMIARRTAAF
jgi:hypothetical protein